MDKLINLDDRALTEVKIILLMGAKNHLGIANLPNESDLNQIVTFLKSKFAEFTPLEIDLALQMYSAGSISVENKPYGVISTLFLSDLLNQYRMHRKMAKEIEERKNNNQKLLEEPKKDPLIVNKKLTEWIIDWVLQKNEIPESYNWDGVFAHLENEKEIDLSVEDKKDFYNLVVEEMNENIRYYKDFLDKREIVMEWLRILQEPKSIQSLCRKKLVHLYLSKLISKKNGTSNRSTDEA